MKKRVVLCLAIAPLLLVFVVLANLGIMLPSGLPRSESLVATMAAITLDHPVSAQLLRLPGADKLVEKLVKIALTVPESAQLPDLSGIAQGVAIIQADASSELEITMNPLTGTPSFIRGAIPFEAVGLRSGLRANAVASALLERYATLFSVEPTKQEQNVVVDYVDDLGIRHIRLAQRFEGVRVYNSYMDMHLLEGGSEILAMSNGFLPGISLATVQPAITAEQALATAQKALPQGITVWGPQLAIFAPRAQQNPGALARISWMVELRDDAVPARNVYVVDALDGMILDVIENLHTAYPTVSPGPAASPDNQAPEATNWFDFPVGERPLTRLEGDADGWTVFGNGYGAKDVAYPGKGCVHPGDDWNKESSPQRSDADVGQVVRSIGPGTVEAIKDLASLGFGIVISHPFRGQTYYSVYIHVRPKVELKLKQSVSRGNPIATIEKFSGVSPHLHFEVRRSMNLTPGVNWYPDDKDCTGDNIPDGYYPSLAAIEAAGFIDPLKFILESRVPNRRIYDAKHGYSLPGNLARSEGAGPTGDGEVDDAYDFAGATFNYFLDVHRRQSYDGQGAPIISTVHYGESYPNAYWDGQQMVYGDDYAVKDVTGHELTHGVTEHSAKLEYEWQSGALSESLSDIFGTMVDRDDWIIGEDLPPHVLAGRGGIRDMSNPGRFGQPEHTRDWVKTCEDKQGVHTNSGITNKAFYNIATAIGKDKAETTFYRTLTVYLRPTSSLEDSRAGALQSAQDLYGKVSAEYAAVLNGFNAVGLDGNWHPPSNNCTCAAVTVLAVSSVGALPGEVSTLDTLTTLYRVRTQLLNRTAVGAHYRGLYEQHTGRIAYLLLLDKELRSSGVKLLKEFTPGLKGLMDGQGGSMVITAQMTAEVSSYLRDLAKADRARGEGALARVIEREMVAAHIDSLPGLTFAQAWTLLNTQMAPASSPSQQLGPFSPMRVGGASGRGDERDLDLYSAVAYDPVTDRYLAVWTTARNAGSSSDSFDVYGSFLDRNGKPIGNEFRISDTNSAARSALPTVAAGDSSFVVAWTVRGASCQIYAQKVTDGANRTDQVLISGAGHHHSSALVYNPVRRLYVMAFVSGDDYMPPTLFGGQAASCGDNASSTSHIKAFEFSFSGEKPVVSNTVKVSDADKGAFRPRLAYSGELNQYLVVWEDRRDAGGKPGFFAVYSQRLGGDLKAIGEDVPLNTSSDYTNFDTSATWTPRPAVAGGHKDYLVAWFDRRQGATATTWSVQARLVSGIGTPGTTFSLARMPFARPHLGRSPTGSLTAAYSSATQDYMVGLSTYLESLWGYFPLALVQRVSHDGRLLGLDGLLQSRVGVGLSVDHENDSQLAISMAVFPKSEAGAAKYLLLYSKHSPKSAEKDFDMWSAVVSTTTSGALVKGTVTLQGRTATFPAGVGHGIARVALNPGGVIVSVGADGSFEIPKVAAGTYTLTASASGYVSRERTNMVVASSTVTIPSVQLRCGLVNSDNFVNINDITATVASFGTSPTNRVDAQGRFVDQNGDGFVNINDITCVVSSFGTTSPQPWP